MEDKTNDGLQGNDEGSVNAGEDGDQKCERATEDTNKEKPASFFDIVSSILYLYDSNHYESVLNFHT